MGGGVLMSPYDDVAMVCGKCTERAITTLYCDLLRHEKGLLALLWRLDYMQPFATQIEKENPSRKLWTTLGMKGSVSVRKCVEVLDIINANKTRSVLRNWWRKAPGPADDVVLIPLSTPGSSQPVDLANLFGGSFVLGARSSGPGSRMRHLPPLFDSDRFADDSTTTTRSGAISVSMTKAPRGTVETRRAKSRTPVQRALDQAVSMPRADFDSAMDMIFESARQVAYELSKQQSKLTAEKLLDILDGPPTDLLTYINDPANAEYCLPLRLFMSKVASSTINADHKRNPDILQWGIACMLISFTVGPRSGPKVIFGGHLMSNFLTDAGAKERLQVPHAFGMTTSYRTFLVDQRQLNHRWTIPKYIPDMLGIEPILVQVKQFLADSRFSATSNKLYALQYPILIIDNVNTDRRSSLEMESGKEDLVGQVLFQTEFFVYAHELESIKAVEGKIFSKSSNGEWIATIPGHPCNIVRGAVERGKSIAPATKETHPALTTRHYVDRVIFLIAHDEIKKLMSDALGHTRDSLSKEEEEEAEEEKARTSDCTS